MDATVWIIVFVVIGATIWFISRKKGGGDDTRFLNNIMRSAEGGDPISQFKLAAMYYEGKDLPRNDVEAAKWYRRAAEQGHVEARFILGIMYEKGDGVPKDDNQAYTWISSAAREGYSRARITLESDKWMNYTMVNNSLGVAEGDAAAPSSGTLTREQIDEYTAKAHEGDVDSQYNLGIIYYHGEGVPRDFEKALAWFRKAAEQDDPDAQYNLGFMYGRGEGVGKDQRQSFEWFRKAAEQGHAGAGEILEKMSGKS